MLTSNTGGSLQVATLLIVTAFIAGVIGFTLGGEEKKEGNALSQSESSEGSLLSSEENIPAACKIFHTDMKIPFTAKAEEWCVAFATLNRGTPVSEAPNQEATSSQKLVQEEVKEVPQEEVFKEKPKIEEKKKTEVKAPVATVVAPLLKDGNEAEGEKVLILNKEEAPYTGPNRDLILSLFSHYGSRLVEGDIMSFSVKIENQGEEDITEEFLTTLSIDLSNDGTLNVLFQPLKSEGLKKGESETKIWKSAWSQKGGTHRGEVCVDKESSVQEIDEKNNCVSIIFEIKGKEYASDLLVTSFEVLTPSPKSGDALTFRSDVLNQGKDIAPAPKFSLFLDSHLIGRKDMSAIPPGERRELMWERVWLAKEGAHIVRVCADNENLILEQNEENNCREISLVISS